MNGHSRWVRSDTSVPDEYMVQFVTGYILALEDVWEDIEKAAQAADPVDEMENLVNKAMGEAMATLKTIKEKMKDATK